jgi:hypothetical protein
MAINKRIINPGFEAPTPPLTTSFNTVLYTGNGGTQSFNIGFRPDFIWFKARNFEWFHIAYDSVRGSNKGLVPSSTSAEFNTTDGLASFNANGFTISGGGWITNRPGYNYVAWCWKAGGAAVTNTDGTITSEVSANPGAGFSIVSYTGNLTASTVGHGLNNTPSIYIVKSRDNGSNWFVYSNVIGNTKYLNLDATIAAATFNLWNNTNPNDSVFSLAGQGDVNANGLRYIAYCFAEVAGFSKFGSYSGSGGAGNKQTIGFEPAFVMFKRTNGVSSWYIVDNKRDSSEYKTLILLADESIAEISSAPNGVKFESDGFSFNGEAFNNSGWDFIYMAFANQF